MKRVFSIFWYVLTLQCEEAERIRCCEGDEPVTWWERLAERLHRLACKTCRRARRELEALNTALHDLVHAEASGETDDPAAAAGPDLSPEARDRIASALCRGESDQDD